MNFRRRRSDEPEINLIPFIDVLLVILIFLMLTTTYSKYTELQLNLPTADAEQKKQRPGEISLTISANGRYAVNGAPVDVRPEALPRQLAAAITGQQAHVVVISADATTPHQAVITAMEAARRAGLSQITFATQTGAAGSTSGL